MSLFVGWRDYWDFEKEVRENRRYVRTENTEKFLAAVKATCPPRAHDMRHGLQLWRAQRGCDVVQMHDLTESNVAYGKIRMKPLAGKQFEGRVNSKGIPCLYLSFAEMPSDAEKAAISEVRPWVDEMVTVAVFTTTRLLKIVDCTKKHPESLSALLGGASPPELENMIWNRINNAFAKPVTRSDDLLDYVPTQVLADGFKAWGYDGVAYRSKFADSASSIALFDLSAADCQLCKLVQVKGLDLNYEDWGPP